jgi:nickel/cobalt transporter (NiCoT) family protein
MLPNDLLAVGLLIFVLGMKHGFDADHLATIDGMARFNAHTRPRLARFCGVLFSLGHGAVVITTALIVSTLAKHWQVPEWLETFGAWVSIVFLAAIGTINLYAVFSSKHDQIVRPVGLKGRLLGRLGNVSNPWMIALIGALFAISFDTLSQVTLFTFTAAWQSALMLGILFTAGMLITDGINGLWISHLINRTHQTALIASRVMSLGVAGVSLLVAAFGVAKQLMPAVSVWSDGKELLLGMCVVGILTCSYFTAGWLTKAIKASN